MRKHHLMALIAVYLGCGGCAKPATGPALGGGGSGGNPASSRPLADSVSGELPGGWEVRRGAPEGAGSLGKRIARAAHELPIPFPYRPGTNGGSLGCADVVSHALEQAGAISPREHQLAVTGVKKLLMSKGWQRVKPPPWADGDVICWAAPRGGKHMHVGIIVIERGEVYAVNNSSSRRRPVKVKLATMHRRVDSVLRSAGSVAS